jgi:hypothetical protein
MHYEICFVRSVHDERGFSSQARPNNACLREELILEELNSTALGGLPDLINWSFPLIDERTGNYEISARFISLLPAAEVHMIFRLALGRGLKGEFRICKLPDRSGQFAAVN